MPAIDQRLDVVDDRADRLGGQRLEVGAPELQAIRVGAVVRGHLGGELRARARVGGIRSTRGVVDLVVDVGDVDHERRCVALVLEEALEQAEHDERPRVADVDAAVNGRAAGVDADLSRFTGTQRQQLAAERVV